MKYLKLYENFDNIENICRSLNINRYTINQDGSIDVFQYVNINPIVQFKFYKKLPLKFGKVDGYFYCRNNKLETLENSPNYVGGYFNVSQNELKSLEYSPKIIDGYFNCDNNELKTLLGGPEKVGGEYYCITNNLIDVYGFPENFKANAHFVDNPVYEIIDLVYTEHQAKFIKWLNEYNVIKGSTIFEEGLNQAFYMATKEELTFEKQFQCYTLR